MHLIRKLGLRIKVNDKWVEVAKDAPITIDEEGLYVDPTVLMREAFGGGILASLDSEVEIHLSWVRIPPPFEDAPELALILLP